MLAGADAPALQGNPQPYAVPNPAPYLAVSPQARQAKRKELQALLDINLQTIVRKGFSLIELLMVISLVVTIAGLTIGAVLGVRSTRGAQATQALMASSLYSALRRSADDDLPRMWQIQQASDAGTLTTELVLWEPQLIGQSAWNTQPPLVTDNLAIDPLGQTAIDRNLADQRQLDGSAALDFVVPFRPVADTDALTLPKSDVVAGSYVEILLRLPLPPAPGPSNATIDYSSVWDVMWMVPTNNNVLESLWRLSFRLTNSVGNTVSQQAANNVQLANYELPGWYLQVEAENHGNWESIFDTEDLTLATDPDNDPIDMGPAPLFEGLGNNNGWHRLGLLFAWVGGEEQSVYIRWNDRWLTNRLGDLQVTNLGLKISDASATPPVTARTTRKRANQWQLTVNLADDGTTITQPTNMPDGAAIGACSVWRWQRRAITTVDWHIAQMGTSSMTDSAEPTFNVFIGGNQGIVESLIYDPVATGFAAEPTTLIPAQGGLSSTINLAEENRLILDPAAPLPTPQFFLGGDTNQPDEQP
jgi:prepilin-type N-terminal cleavage/methylation domain-containing protein